MVNGAQEFRRADDFRSNEPSGVAPLGAAFERLVDEARGGSPAALGQLLEGCRRYLLLVANDSLDSDLRPKVGASDLVQDTFLEAHRDFSHFHGTTESELLAWLTKILTNRVCNNVRHYRGTLKRDVEREVSLEAEWEGVPSNVSLQLVTPTHATVEQDEAERLREAIVRLPKAMRDVLVLRTWERQTFVEIAAQLGGSADSMRKLWGRAVRKLQSELEKRP
jgi:RNA polymerase sigma-70 factor (ECF subfamily)